MMGEKIRGARAVGRIDDASIDVIQSNDNMHDQQQRGGHSGIDAHHIGVVVVRYAVNSCIDALMCYRKKFCLSKP
jgi:hypothetical protein